MYTQVRAQCVEPHLVRRQGTGTALLLDATGAVRVAAGTGHVVAGAGQVAVSAKQYRVVAGGRVTAGQHCVPCTRRTIQHRAGVCARRLAKHGLLYASLSHPLGSV